MSQIISDVATTPRRSGLNIWKLPKPAITLHQQNKVRVFFFIRYKLVIRLVMMHVGPAVMQALHALYIS